MPAVINSNTTLSKINIAAQKADAEAQWKTLAQGIASDLGDVASFVINGATFTKDAVVAKVQSRIDAAEKTKAARTVLHACVAAERVLQTDVAPLRAGLKTFLQSRYGKTSAELQKFGFTPAKVPQRSAIAKADGVAKARATRKARGTKGSKQKAPIKGTVATNTAPATTSPVASPASAAKPA
jgi:hypothetical protein